MIYTAECCDTARRNTYYTLYSKHAWHLSVDVRRATDGGSDTAG